MPAVVTEIDPGVCGFLGRVTASSEDMQHVALVIESECEKVRAFGAALESVDAFDEIQQGHGGRIQDAARQCMVGCCAGCVVPSGVYKSVQVAAGLALPMECSIIVKRQ